MAMRQLLLLLSLFCLAYAQTPLCHAGIFDITPLTKATYWSVQLKESYCSQFFSNETCILHMAFCRPLPDTISGCNTSESVLGPTSVCITDGTLGYSMGAYDDTVNPFFDFRNETIIAGYSDGSTNDHCRDPAKIQITIEFDCGVHAQWELAESPNGEVTHLLTDWFVNIEDPCLFSAKFDYDRVCMPQKCEAPDHDIQTLTSPDYWKVELNKKHCDLFFENSSSCTLYMSFCKSLEGVKECSDLINSTICLTNGSSAFSLGQYYAVINPFTNFKNDSLLVGYQDGTNYKGCTVQSGDSVKSVIELECDREERWSYSGSGGDATPHLTTLIPDPADPCLVLLVLKYSGACIEDTPSPSSSSGSGGQVGWVGLGLLLALLAIVLLYVTIGSLINVARGRNGPEVLPNYGFWKAFFIAFTDGVYFSANFCTCGACNRQMGAPPTTEYDKL